MSCQVSVYEFPYTSVLDYHPRQWCAKVQLRMAGSTLSASSCRMNAQDNPIDFRARSTTVR